MKRLWLEAIRLEKNMTHEDVAKQARISRNYYTMIENGSRRPGVSSAQRVASVLGFDWTVFFDVKCNESQHTA